MKLAKIAPWAGAVLAVGLVANSLLPRPAVHGFDLDAFGRLPVLEGGRVKPLDSVARNALLVIRSKQTVPAEVPAETGETRKETLSATRWVLDVMFRPELADRVPAFAIDEPQVLGMMKIPASTNRYYAFQALAPFAQQIQEQAERAAAVEAANQSRFQVGVTALAEKMWLYTKLKLTAQLPGTPLAAEIQGAGAAGAENRRRTLEQYAHFRPLPPAAGARAEAWRTVGGALGGVAAGKSDPILAGWARIGLAWEKQDAAAFNQAVKEVAAIEAAAAPAAVRQGARELVFNRTDPFTLGITLYVLALLLVFVSWLWKPEALRPTAFVMLVAGALVHTGGLAARIVLQGRPPVTNLYSSAVMVGWVAVIVGIVLEAVYRRGFATLVAGAIGFGTLIIALHLANTGDTMEMMRAVLDSNFWLSTHVVTIIIGYGGTFLAGAMAIAATFYRHLVPDRPRSDDRDLSGMIYGVICFALFFSFVGTVLGGIWADQSWGRFWGWDPKENGALLIVLWNAIILHARWGGFVRERGIAAMAIFGNVITSLSWFGVNMLGVGLHSYGFSNKGFWWLVGFIASQLVLMAVALVPEQFWRPAGDRGASRVPVTRPVH